MKNKECNTTLPEAKVIKNFDKWSVESYKYGDEYKLAISDGWTVIYPMIKNDSVIGGSVYIPDEIFNYLENNINKIKKLLTKRKRCLKWKKKMLNC